MNTVSHALIGYTASTIIFGPEMAHQYAAPILIASTIMDLDHLPYIFKHIKASIYSLKAGSANAHIAGICHKFVTQLVFIMAMMIASFFVDKALVTIILLNVFLHFGVDALVSNSDRIFWPFSDHSLSIRILGTHKARVFIDTMSIPVLAFILWAI